MRITLNGTPRTTREEQPSVRDLLTELGLHDRPVAVEVNQQVVPRKLHPQAVLREGDAVEVVTLVGGG